MLKNIPPIISPNLLKILAEMGHGDEIVIGDGNFPTESIGKNLITIRADGHGVPEILSAILTLFPLDEYVQKPVTLMKVVSGDDYVPVIWNKFNEILIQNQIDTDKVDKIERFDFYERSKKAYAIIATGESAIYANIILKKGVVKL